MRRRYIGEILSRQLADGGWALSGETGDPDMTGMALTALAKYRAQPDARRAIDRALGLRFDYATGEGAAQMLVAYATLGEPTDALVDELLRYRNSDGGFNHIIGGGDSGQMATEQALYALAAARRARDGEKTLYDMSDVTKNVSDALASATANHSERPADKGLPGKREDVTAAAVTSPGKTFADISGHANQAAIEALAARGIISGKAENRFAPDATITRAEFASIITSGLGLPERPTPAFDDVPASAWFFPAVGSARYYGIVSGSSPKTFNPNGIVTRQESAVMITKAAKLCGIDADIDEASVRDTLAQFGDYRAAADWAKPSLAFCYVNDIWDDSELDINPSAPIKRCEMAEMLYRLSDAAKLL
jgi:hypothetical protein